MTVLSGLHPGVLIRSAFAAILSTPTLSAAYAQGTGGPTQPSQPAAPEVRQGTAGGQSNKAGPYSGLLMSRSVLLGDPLGIQTRTAARGISFGLAESAEVIGNLTGGTRRGAVFEGLLAMSVGLDTEKAGLWPDGIFNASAYQIHGRGLSLNNLANNGNTVSGLEALRGTLLFELWFEQYTPDKKLSVRIGQFAVDQEFLISQYGGLFINHTFGWPTLPSTNLPASGPSFPLAALGIRARYAPTSATSILLGLFNGDAAGPGSGIPQTRDTSGTDFRLHDGLFAIGEVQYVHNGDGGAVGLPGTFKLGGWYNSLSFADQRFNSLGASLADPGNNPGQSSGHTRKGNWSVYGVADQLVGRKAGTKDQGIGVFARLMGSPGDRNLVNFYADVGLTWKGAIAGRDSDTAGIAFGLARTSDSASALDSDVRNFTGGTYPIRRHESVLELTYQAQIAPWWQVQPTAQYVFNINGGVNNPLVPGRRLNDAAVLGLRTNITF